jgi:xylulokinase
MTTSTFRPDYQQRMLACGQSAVSGLWHPYAYINGGGLNVEWFLREIVNRGHTKNDALITLGELEKQADIIPASADLPLFVPHLGGRVSPAQPNLRGAWTELSWSHTLPALYRALLEGVALEYAVYQEGLRDLYPDLKWKELRLTGGGAHSTLWTAIKADALQLPIRRVARGEGAPLGAALLAGYGVGVFKSLPDAARQWISLEKATLPRRSLKPLYAQRLARYQDLLHSLDRL